jgi:molybdate transport system ATP-binding protein
MLRFEVHKSLDMEGGKELLRANGELPSGGLGVVHGASGAGKSTLLKVLAGVLKGERERIRFGEERWADAERGVRLSARKRAATLLFQRTMLFPNMSVEKNLRSALPKGKGKEPVNEWIERAGLTSLRSSKPAKLSGGQRQRVGILRALAAFPKLLLLDEPFSALDDRNRQRMIALIDEVRKREGMSVLIASHEPLEEELELDRTWCLEEGELRSVEERPSATMLRMDGLDRREERILGVVLAGGKSRRMGRDKGLMEVDGKRMAQHSLDALEALTDARLIVSKNPSYAEFGVPIVPDLWPDHGPLGGILTAFLASDADEILVLPCDMPYMEEKVLRGLLDGRGGPGISIAQDRGKWEPLVGIYPRSFIEPGKVMLEKGVRSVHEALERLGREWVHPVELGEDPELQDFHPFRNLNEAWEMQAKASSYET